MGVMTDWLTGAMDSDSDDGIPGVQGTISGA
jgi:hypothetical protein